MKLNHGSSNSCSSTFCVSKNEIALTQGEASNKETLNLKKRHPLKSKQKKIKTIGNVVAQSFLSGSENSFQSDGFYHGVEYHDAVERSSAVLDLVRLVNKAALLEPNRLSESCSFTTGSVYQQDYNKRRRRRSSYNYASAIRQRCGSNFTLSKKRSILLKTILNTKFTQSTPNQCTFKFKSIRRNQSIVKVNYIMSLPRTKKLSEYSPTKESRIINEEYCAQSTFKSKNVVLPNLSQNPNNASEKDNNMLTLSNELSSLQFGSQFSNSISDVLISDLSSKYYMSKNLKNIPSDNFSFEKPKNIVSYNNDIIDLSQGMNELRSNPLVVISASSLIPTHSKVNFTWRNEAHLSNNEQNYGEPHDEKEITPSRFSRKTQKQGTDPQFTNDKQELHYVKTILQENAVVLDNFDVDSITNHDKPERTGKIVIGPTDQCKTKLKHYSISSHKQTLCRDRNQDTKKSFEKFEVQPEKIQAKTYSLATDYTHKHTKLKKHKRKKKSSERKSLKQASLGQSVLQNYGENHANTFDNEDEDRYKLALKISENENQIFVHQTNDTNKNFGTKSKKKTIDVRHPHTNIGEQLLKRKKSQDLNLISISADTEHRRSKLFGSIVRCFNSLTKNKKQSNTGANIPLNDSVDSSPRVDERHNKKKNLNNLASLCKKKSKQSISLNKHGDTKYCQTAYNRNEKRAVTNLWPKLYLQYHNAAEETLKIINHDKIKPKILLDESNCEVLKPICKTSITQKLKTYVSSFHFQKKCKTELSQDSLHIDVKNKQYACNKMMAAKSKKADTSNLFLPSDCESDNYDIQTYYPYVELLNRNKYLPLLHYSSFRNQSRYSSKIKQQKNSYKQYMVQQKHLLSSISDTQSFSDSVYSENVNIENDFTEDNLIYKAIKAAINRQIVKERRSKFEYGNKSRYFNQNLSIHGHTFPQKLYAMNVHKLKPYECEPGVCVPNPDECDPYECLKLINKRFKKGASTGTTPGTRSSSSYAPGYTGPRRRQKTQDRGPYRPRRKRSSGAYAGRESFSKGVSYNKPPKNKKPKRKNAVRLGSSFCFDVEFSKGKTGGDAYLADEKRGLRKSQVGEQTPERKYRHSSTSTIDPVKHGKLKRCFCTLKLQKKGKNDQPQEMTAEQGSSTASIAQNTNRRAMSRHLDPHECEPNVCIPGSCDPHECLERNKKFRDRGFSPEPIVKTSTSGTDPGLPKRRQTVEMRPRGKSATTAREHHKQNSPQKQAVKIGSTFSFSLEFYKKTAPTEVEVEDDEPEPEAAPRKPRRKIRGKKVGRASQPITEYSVDRGAGAPRRRDIHGLHDQGVESRLGSPVADRGTETLRRCFCTLKLHKHGKVPADQVKVVKHNATKSNKYKCDPYCYNRGANTKNLLPYECEPGTCIPGECDPNECYKRIQARYLRETGTTTKKRGRNYRSQSTATIYKHAGTGRRSRDGKHIGRRSRGLGCDPHCDDVSQSITSVSIVEERRPILQKTRQAVRLGSDFKFNIEFFKDKTVHKTVPIAPKVPIALQPRDDGRVSTFTRVPHRRGRKFINNNSMPCECPVVEKTKDQKEGGNAKSPKKEKATKANTKDQRHGSTMTKIIKRCFCTMSLQKNRGKTQTVYTMFPDIQSPYKYIARECISITTTSKSCENSVTTANKSSKNPFSVTKKCYQRSYNTEKLLKEVFDRPEWLFSNCKDINRCEYNKKSLVSVNDDNEYDNDNDDDELIDNWHSVTGFRSYIQKNICAMRADTITCGAKTCKKQPGPCNLPSCLKRTRVKKALVDQKPNLKEENEQCVGVDPKTLKEELRQSGVVKLGAPKIKSRDNKIKEERKLRTTRIYLHSNAQNEPDRRGPIVEESRFKSINDPFRQAVRISSSFTFNVEFSRDKLPDDLKLPPYQGPYRPREGISIQTQKHMPRMTERNIGIGAGQMGQRCPCAAKLEKMGIIEMKHKNVHADFPYQTYMRDKGVGTKHRIKSPYDCDPNMCYPELCRCYEKKLKRLKAKEKLHKRQSVQLGSKFTCNLEFFKDDTYAVGPPPDYGQYNTKNKQSRFSNNKFNESPKHHQESPRYRHEPSKYRHNDHTREDYTRGRDPQKRTESTCNRTPVSQKQVGSANVKTKESGVAPYLKRCFCALKCQKQIVNYLSVDVKSPVHLEDNRKRKCDRSLERNYCNEERYLTLDKKSDLFSQTDEITKHNRLENVQNNYCFNRQRVNNIEMETLYPYIPKKFNTNISAALLQNNQKKKLHKKHRDKKCQRISKKSTKYGEIQNNFLGQGKVPRAKNFFRSLTRVFFKKPRCKDCKCNNVTNRKKRRKFTMESRSNTFSRLSHRNRKQVLKAEDTLKVSKSDRRPVKSQATKYPKKCESAWPSTSVIRKTRKRKRHIEHKKRISRYVSEESDSQYQILTKDKISKYKSNLYPYMDSKQVYLSLGHTNNSAYKYENRTDKPVINNNKHFKPTFDMHLHAGDMSLLNRNIIYDKIMQLKCTHAHNNSQKIMKQLHGEGCCCCVCIALRKQAKEVEKKKEQEEKKREREEKEEKETETVTKRKISLESVKKINKFCVCKSKKCEKEAIQKELPSKVIREANRCKHEVCHCGPKICKKESLIQVLRSKLDAEKKKKYERLLQTATEKDAMKKINKHLREVLHEEKLEQRKQREADKKASNRAKRLKKLHDSDNIVLCIDALIDFLKYKCLTVFSIVRCLFKTIVNPKLTYYKCWYPQKKGVGDTLQSSPGPLASLCNRMKTRVFHSKTCKAAIERAESNECLASVLTACDGKKRKPKMKRPLLIHHGDVGCSLCKSPLRRKTFLKVYYTCPWFYQHCINFLKLGKNVAELLLFGLVVLVWSPCILCKESCRAVTCCTSCTG